MDNFPSAEESRHLALDNKKKDSLPYLEVCLEKIQYAVECGNTQTYIPLNDFPSNYIPEEVVDFLENKGYILDHQDGEFIITW